MDLCKTKRRSKAFERRPVIRAGLCIILHCQAVDFEATEERYREVDGYMWR